MRRTAAVLFLALCVAVPVAAQENAEPPPHSLQELLKIAERREKEIRGTIKDYTCLIVKRERINGILQPHRFIDAKVRPAQEINGKKMPLAVHLTFLKPKSVHGRTVIFIDGQNNGEMMVRRGGERLQNVVVNVDPTSDLAKNESLMHIGHLGFDSMVSEILAQIRKDIQADPTGSNTQLKISRNATINQRPCTSIQIVHPNKAEGLLYHRAEFFVDNEIHLPVRVAAFDWPKDGKEPELMGEFTYTKVKINVGLTDADFDMSRIRTAAR